MWLLLDVSFRWTHIHCSGSRTGCYTSLRPPYGRKTQTEPHRNLTGIRGNSGATICRSIPPDYCEVFRRGNTSRYPSQNTGSSCKVYAGQGWLPLEPEYPANWMSFRSAQWEVLGIHPDRSFSATPLWLHSRNHTGMYDFLLKNTRLIHHRL